MRQISAAVIPQKVLIVGAGIAGLVAAYELLLGGHDVQILEARMRPGGRIYTVREPFTDDSHAEAGAIDIGDEYIRAYRVRTADAPRTADLLINSLRSKSILLSLLRNSRAPMIAIPRESVVPFRETVSRDNPVTTTQ